MHSICIVGGRAQQLTWQCTTMCDLVISYLQESIIRLSCVCEGLLVYRGVCYHLVEWGQETIYWFFRQSSQQELFNVHHALAQNVIEQLFGVLKLGFKILTIMPEYSMATHWLQSTNPSKLMMRSRTWYQRPMTGSQVPKKAVGPQRARNEFGHRRSAMRSLLRCESSIKRYFRHATLPECLG